MKRVMIEKTMEECLLEAFKNNAVITSDGLAQDEFIHVYNGEAYYEDGCWLGYFQKANSFLHSQDWVHSHKWYIIGYMTEEEIKAIKELRKNLKLRDDTYKQELIKFLGMSAQDQSKEEK